MLVIAVVPAAQALQKRKRRTLSKGSSKEINALAELRDLRKRLEQLEV